MKRTVLFIFAAMIWLQANPLPKSGATSELRSQFSSEERPWIWWFWLGNIVTEESIDRHLESFHRSGIGGVNIISTYGVKGYEQKQITYRSEQWYKLVAHTIKRAGELGMGVDMALTSAWPFGGPQVSKQNGAKFIKGHISFPAVGEISRILTDNPENEYVISVSAFSQEGDYMDLTPFVQNGVLKAKFPAGQWNVEAITGGFTGQMVKRSSPGGEGYVIDHFDDRAANEYLSDFDRDAAKLKGLRGTFNDSYEVYGGDFTPALIAAFEKRRGYSPKPYLHLLFDTDKGEIHERFLCDYRLTMSELILENFMNRWAEWSAVHGFKTTEQAHGAPANTLDLYGAADIPCVESFGPSCFNIPYVRVDPDTKRDRYKWPDKLFLKFGSSAANVNGRRLVAAESPTWLTNHFRTALSQVKPQFDELFIAGINHIHLISATNTPFDSPYPGWVFYPAPDFGPGSGFYDYLPDLSLYVAGIQKELQRSRADNDILVYYPLADYFSSVKSDLGVLSMMDHITTKWGDDFSMAVTAGNLWKNGYSFDYISDLQIGELSMEGKNLVTGGGNRYKTIVIPACRFMPDETMAKLISLAAAGANIVFDTRIADDVPGLGNLTERLSLLNARRKAICGFENVDVSPDLDSTLLRRGLTKEYFAENGLEYIRRQGGDGEGKIYFIANQDNIFKSGWVKPGVDFTNAVLTDPVTGFAGRPKTEKRSDGNYVFLEILPGQSVILKTDTGGKNLSEWSYFTSDSGQTLNGTWEIVFEKGEKDAPRPLKTDKLISWTKLGDTTHIYYNGTGVYTTTFDKPQSLKGRRARLLFTDLRDMAEVFINGKSVGRTWSVPYLVDFDTKLLKAKGNTLTIRVTNPATNKIIRMDRNKIEWQECYIADPKKQNYNTAQWDIEESGIIGDVKLLGSND